MSEDTFPGLWSWLGDDVVCLMPLNFESEQLFTHKYLVAWHELDDRYRGHVYQVKSSLDLVLLLRRSAARTTQEGHLQDGYACQCPSG